LNTIFHNREITTSKLNNDPTKYQHKKYNKLLFSRVTKAIQSMCSTKL